MLINKIGCDMQFPTLELRYIVDILMTSYEAYCSYYT
jgi:hypothetical protein